MLKELISAFARSFANIHNEEFTKHPSRKLLEDVKTYLEVHSSEYNEQNHRMAISIGQGTPSLVPWITCISKRADITTTKGIYLVYLFSADMKYLYLSLIQGTEQIAKEYTAQQDVIFNKVKNYLTNFITYSNEEMVESIDLALSSKKKDGFAITRPARYEKGNIIAYKYTLQNLPNDEKMILDLNHMITIMDHIVNNVIKLGGVDSFYKTIISNTNIIPKPVLKIKEPESNINDIVLVDEPERQPKKEKSIRTSTPVTRKIDYISKAKKDLDTGITGEILIVSYEKEKLTSYGLGELASKVVHISTISDSHGYDIESFDEYGKKIFIEVKTTTGDEKEPFFLSVNEYETYLKNIGSYFIYRVYNIGSEPKFFIISDLSKYNLKIQGYKVE